MKKAIALLCIVVWAIGLAACSGDDSVDERFGLFSVGGVHLSAFASENITSSQANQMINRFGTTISTNLHTAEDRVDSVMNTFGGIDIEIITWILDDDHNLIKDVQEIQVTGTPFLNLLQSNTFVINQNMQVNNILVGSDFVAWAEAENLAARQLIGWNTRPPAVNNAFTFHRNAVQNLVIRSNGFTEIHSGMTAGGTAAHFLQQNEFQYNGVGMLTNFQSSLGLVVNTVAGTVHSGTNFEVIFNWIERAV